MSFPDRAMGSFGTAYMPENAPSHRDRYDVSGNVEAEFIDADQTVMVNKLGLPSLKELQLAEEESLAKAYETLSHEIRVDTPLTNELLLHIHRCIFGNLFNWGGRWRTVNISKPGVTWPPALFVSQAMADFERNTLSTKSPGLLYDNESFCAAVAEIQGEFLVVHPFREGNARTIKLFTDLFSAQTGRPFLIYDESDAGRNACIVAASQAFRKNYQPFIEIIRTALRKGQQR